MSQEETPLPPDIAAVARQIGDPHKGVPGGFNIKGSDGYSEKLVDQIEMIGEEQAAGFKGPESDKDAITPGMRYLHCSRTIHQLVTDRNRAVGIFLAVASLLLTASGAIFHATPHGELIIPIEKIQRWCLPITFGILTILAFFVNFLLVRTRIGLIYEVAKMNALLGLPLGRVVRNSPLSIHFLLQVLISLLGGACAGIFALFMLSLTELPLLGVWASLIALAMAGALMYLYIATVNYTTSDERLQKLK